MSKMKIAATKVFANYANRVAKEEGKRWFAEKIWDSRACEDLIHVNYPYEYFACPRAFSTSYLNRECRRRHVKDEKDLRAMIIDLFEI